MHLHDLSRPTAVLEICQGSPSAGTRHERSQQPRARHACLDASVMRMRGMIGVMCKRSAVFGCSGIAGRFEVSNLQPHRS